jgi:hypothetical protein
MAKGVKTGGRVKGTPNKATADVKTAAQAYTSEAVETLATIMRNAQMPAAARVSAASAILDRGHGKPTQAVELDATIEAGISEIRRTVVDP